MTASATKMVNGRVDERYIDKARRVLNEQGLTVSAFIRNSIENIARTGVVPKCGFPTATSSADIEGLRQTMRDLESLPMPGRADFEGLSEDDLVERFRMEKYGY